MEVTLTMIAIGTVASFFAGLIDSIAGGGGLVTMPALLLAGVPPHATLGTNKLSSSLGTFVSLLTYARGHMVEWRMAPLGIVSSLIGAWLGSLVALQVSPDMLGKILVALLPVGMLMTLIPKKEISGAAPVFSGPRFWLTLGGVGFVVGMYDGFFGPGAGSFFIIAFHVVLRIGLVQASATSKVLNLASNVGALFSFVCHGEVLYALGLPMAAANMAGNWAGARLAIRKGAGMVRHCLFVSLTLLLGTLAYKYLLQ